MGSHAFFAAVLLSLCCQAVLMVTGQSTITFVSREGLVVNEEDGFVRVCLQRMGTQDQLNQSETVFIQAQEAEPEPMSGTGMGITVEEEDAATGMLSGTWPLMSAGALVLPITFTLLENLTHHS